MKKLLLIVPLLISFASYALPLVQPFVELGMVCKQHFIGPIDFSIQSNSFIKGFIFGSTQTFGAKRFVLPKTNRTEKDLFLNSLSNNIPLLFSSVDLIKNHHNICTVTRFLGWYAGKRLVEKYA